MVRTTFHLQLKEIRQEAGLKVVLATIINKNFNQPTIN